jgi:predicted nucleic acid-binding protein
VRWIVDASVAAAYLMGAGTEQEREALLGDVHAPALVDVEVTHTLRGLVRGGRLPLASAEAARADLPWLGIHRHPDAVLLDRAWELRDRCTIYDALYVALTEVADATLITRDAPLARGIADLIDVQLTA